MEAPMQTKTPATTVETTVRDHSNTLFASLELSKAKWLVTANSPGEEKFSKHVVEGGDGALLLVLLARLKAKAEQRRGVLVKIVVIQEAGLDGFWIHRLLVQSGIESHVVEAASIAVARRHRRAKTDAIDGVALLRTLMAWARGERRVCSMVRPPSPEEEDQRRLSRERGTLLKERIQHTNRIKGLLSGQGIRGYDPLKPDRFDRLDAEIRRELARIDVVASQLATVERARDALVRTQATEPTNPSALLIKLKGVGIEFASLVWLEGLFRSFTNRRQVAAYAGLAPSPWQSGGTNRDQGISKAGNHRLRHVMIELAWFWLRHQPDSALSRWFRNRVGTAEGRVRRIAIVALARKLLVALWRYVTQGVVPEGATLKVA